MKLSDNISFISFLSDIFDTNYQFACSHNEDFFDSFKDDQTPRATVLKCSDSRVQIESFDKNPQNDIFAIRNIGNQIHTSEGSVDFGIRILKTPFLVIIGHSACGAVSAVLSNKKTNIEAIDKELETLKLTEIDPKLAIIENISNQVNIALTKYQDLISINKLVILGLIYDFKNDFGFGKGRIIALSINGEKIDKEIKAELNNKIKNFNFLNNN